MADITKSALHINEEFVLGRTAPIRPSGVSALLSLATVPVKGLYVITFTAAIAALTNTVTRQLQEFTVTDTSHTVSIAVGDLFIPFHPGIGATAGLVNDTLTIHPAKAVTAHKVPVVIMNHTAAATDPNDTLTLTYLWIKVA